MGLQAEVVLVNYVTRNFQRYSIFKLFGENMKVIRSAVLLLSGSSLSDKS